MLSLQSKKTKLPSFGLLAILLVAAFLRFYRLPAYMEFLGDQGRDVLLVRQFLTKGDLMFIGPQTSIGNMYLGPWYYYLMAPFLWLAHYNPVGPAIMVALFGIATVWLVYKVGEEWFDGQTGLLAAFLAAVSPVIVYYSIFSWNPNIMPFFALLSMWFLWQVWRNHKYQQLVWLAVSLAMVLNSHYLGLLLLPVVVIFWLWVAKNNCPEKKEKKQLIFYSLAALAIFLFLMSPLVLFDLKHHFANFEAFRHFFAVRQTTVNFKFYKGFLKLPLVFNQLFTNLLMKKDFWTGSYFLVILLLWGIWKERKNPALWLLVTWLLIGLLGLGNYKQHIYAHYYGFLYPAAALLLAISLRRLKLWSLPLILGLAYLMLANWHGWQPPNYQLKRTRMIVSFIEGKSRGKKFALALLAKQNYDAPYRYFLFLDKASLVDLHEKIPGQLFVICEPWGLKKCEPLGNPLWEIAAFGWAKIDQQWTVGGVKIFRLVHLES